MNLWTKLAYSQGNIAASITAGAFSTFAMFFYVDTLRLPPALFGTAMVIYSIWNAINDPIAGQISDRTRTRWGRRIPYISFGALPFALFFVLVWTPPLRWIHGNNSLLFLYYLIVVFLYDALYTVVILNWTALFPEMFPSLGERAGVSAMRQVFGIVGNILGVALPPIFFTALGWAGMGLLFGGVALISLIISLIGSRERPEFAGDPALGLLESLRYTFANRSFVTFVLVSFFVQLTFVILQAAVPFYAKYVLGISGFQVTLLLGSIFIAALPMVYLWSKATVRWGARTTFIVSMIFYGLAFLPFLFVTSFGGAIITAVLVGLGLAGLIVLMDVLISDVIDEDELKTGTRREGMYFGVNALVVRLGISLQAVIMSAVFTLTGYNPALAVQPATAATGMRILMSLVPIGSLVLALAAILLYPLHGERLAAVRAGIGRLHVEKIQRNFK